MEDSVKDVFELGYMRMIRFSLSTIAQWPNKNFGTKTRAARIQSGYHYILVTIIVVGECSCALYLWRNRKILDFFNIGHVYGNILMTALLIQRITLNFQNKYCSVLKKFASEFHLMHHAHKSDFAAKEHSRINRFCKIVTIVNHVQVACGLPMYLGVPHFNNIRAGMFSENRPANKTFEQSVYYELPFDCTTDVTGYYIMFFYNWYPAYNVCAAMCIIDVTIFVIVFHILGHLNVLMHNMKYFPRPSDENEQSEREYNEQAFGLLKDLVQHYQIIKEFMSDTSSAFDMTLFVYLAFHQLNGCVLLLELSSMKAEAIIKYGLLTFFTFQQLIQTSVIFEQISSKSEQLAHKVYGLPWELMDTKNRKIVLLLFTDVQKKLALKVCSIVPVGVTTMSAIIKTTISYFMLLNTIAK